MQMIEQHVLETVKIMLEPRLQAMHWHGFSLEPGGEHHPGELTVHCRVMETDYGKTLVLRVIFIHKTSHGTPQVLIPNILMPKGMTGERLGKRTIKAIFDVAAQLGYHLLIVDLVPAFRRRLLARGGRDIDVETVQITPDTDLTSDVGSPVLGTHAHLYV